MGFREAKSKGGFLNNVDGKIIGYEFTNKNVSGEKTEWVFGVPSLAIDGSDKTVTQHTFWGGVDQYEIAKDGKSISMVDGSPFRYTTEGKKGFISGPYFLTSLLDGGLDEAEIDVEGDTLNPQGIVGYRVRFVQVKDEKATKERGQRTFKTADGREGKADQTVLGVSAVYGKEGSAPKGATTKPTLAKGKSTANAVNTIRDKADAALQALIAKAGGPLPLAKISVGIIRELVNDSDKNAVKDLAKSVAYLADATERGILLFDEDEGTVQAA